jgi:uncharacterized phage protein gp47/JayE
MPWTTPSLEQVREENRDYVTARLHSGAMVPNSALRVLADANAGLAYLTLLYIDWLSKQLLPDTAETEWLDRHAQIWLGGRKAATYATGTANVTGIAGTAVPAGAQLTGPGGTYQTTAAITIGTGPTPVNIVALTSGVAGNADPGTTLSFSTPITNVDSSASIVTLTGGTDAETDDELRARILLRIRNPPMGGDAEDYVQWTLAIPGVTRAWSYPQEQGMGTVTVRFMMDDLRAPTGFPTPSDVAMVTLALDKVRPVAVKDFFIESPNAYPISFIISNLVVDNPSTEQAINDSIVSMLHDKAVPGQTVYRSWIDEAIAGTANVDHYDLTFTDTNMPNNGALAVLGTITFA